MNCCAGQSYDQGEPPIKGNQVNLTQYFCDVEGDGATSQVFLLTPRNEQDGAEKHGKRVWIFRAHSAQIRSEWQESFILAGCGRRPHLVGGQSAGGAGGK